MELNRTPDAAARLCGQLVRLWAARHHLLDDDAHRHIEGARAILSAPWTHVCTVETTMTIAAAVSLAYQTDDTGRADRWAAVALSGGVVGDTDRELTAELATEAARLDSSPWTPSVILVDSSGPGSGELLACIAGVWPTARIVPGGLVAVSWPAVLHDVLATTGQVASSHGGDHDQVLHEAGVAAYEGATLEDALSVGRTVARDSV